MHPDSWFKRFGDQRPFMYYHLLDMEDEDWLNFHVYIYDPLQKKVLNKTVKRLSFIDFSHELLTGDFHPLNKNQVPFLIPL